MSNSNERKSMDYHIHQGFTSDEIIFIENALRIINDRLFQPNLLLNMDRICGTYRHFIDQRVWSRSHLQNHSKSHLLHFQLMCLKTIHFPRINIYPIWKNDDTQAMGNIGCVRCIEHRSTISIKGQFHIKLNRFNLDIHNERFQANSIYWAGAIVHEMLHNLGHMHSRNDYSDRWQINVFENAFIYDGKYSGS